jgi:hypothetical protein
VLTECVADRKADEEACPERSRRVVAFKLMMWAWKLGKERRGGLTTPQFVRAGLMRLEMGEDLTHIICGGTVRQIASVEEVRALQTQITDPSLRRNRRQLNRSKAYPVRKCSDGREGRILSGLALRSSFCVFKVQALDKSTHRWAAPTTLSCAKWSNCQPPTQNQGARAGEEVLKRQQLCAARARPL